MPRRIRIKDDVSRELLLCPECGELVHTEPTEQVPNQALRTCDKCSCVFIMDLSKSPVYPSTTPARKPASRPQSPTKQQAYLFFLRHAGLSYNPATETRQQGRAAGARRLAAAERDARALGYRFEWQYDPAGCIGGGAADCDCSTGRAHECMVCLMLDPAGVCRQSLGSVCKPSRDYRRVVEAELALEEVGK